MWNVKEGLKFQYWFLSLIAVIIEQLFCCVIRWCFISIHFTTIFDANLSHGILTWALASRYSTGMWLNPTLTVGCYLVQFSCCQIADMCCTCCFISFLNYDHKHNSMIFVLHQMKIDFSSVSCFRDGCDWLFQELHKHDVPLLILSAGIGDIILEVIKQRAVLYNNIHVVSNFMDFDSEVSCLLSYLLIIIRVSQTRLLQIIFSNFVRNKCSNLSYCWCPDKRNWRYWWWWWT